MKPRVFHWLLIVNIVLAGLVAALPQTRSLSASPMAEEAIDPGEWDQGNLSLAADGSGNLYAAWQDYRNGSVAQIRFAYRPGGGSWTSSVVVDPTGDQDQLSPSLAVDGAGNAYLAWEDNRTGSAAEHIRFAYRPAGGAWSASEVISATAIAQEHPALAVNSSGAAVVAWRQGNNMPAEIYAALRPAGGPWGAAEQVTPATGDWRYEPSVALDDAGRAYAVWAQYETGGWSVYYASRLAGGVWSAAEKVNDAPESGWAVPYLAVPAAGSGPVHAIWMDERAGNLDIYHATRPLDGAWSANVRVNDDAGSADQYRPSLALDGAGAATAVWVDRRNGGWDLYQAVRPAGGSWGANTLLVASPLPGGIRSPAFGSGAIDMPTAAAGGRVTGYSKATTSNPETPHNVYMHANTGQLARIEVTPSEVSLQIGNTQQFTANGYDALGNPVAINPTWSATGGTITQGGLYTAGTQAGDFVVTARVQGSSIIGTATVHVTPGLLARIDVTPSEVSLQIGNTQQFTANGYDAFGNPLPISPTWSATGGTITQGGLYTAGSLPGRYAVFAAAGQVRGRAWARIVGPAYCPDLGPGQAWEHTFPIAGVYPYYDRFQMAHAATIVVSPTLQMAQGDLGATVVVSITAAGFTPLTVTIGLNDTVRWTNADSSTHAVNGGEPYRVYLPLVVRH